MIAAEKITKKFNHSTAVHEVSFEVKEGETLVLLGTSGCGKTTTLRMLNRLIEPTSGNIFLRGKNISSISPEILRRSIGYVLQNNGLFPHYTVEENIAIVPKLLKWPKEKIHERTKELMEKLQLPYQQFASVFPNELSGGQQQRIGLARALAAYPPILLMDEPFGALDPITKVAIRKEFKELDELKTKTVVLVTHDVQEAFELGDKICLMDKGEIVQTGTPADLMFHPANEFARNFFNYQRLQLELKSISLQSAWEEFPSSTNPSDLSINNDKTLWELMEIITQKSASGSITVTNEQNKEVKQIDFQALQAAYFHIKQQH